MKAFLKVSVFSAALFVLLVSYTAAFCAEKEAGNPVFFVKEKVVDVGQVYEEADLHYDFIVENHGQGELHINRVKAG